MTDRGFKKLPEEVVVQLAQIQQAMERLASQANAMLFGVRKALQVPDDWEYIQGKGFKEPEPQPKGKE